MGYLAWMVWFLATIVVFGLLLAGTVLMATGWHRTGNYRHFWSVRHQ